MFSRFVVILSFVQTSLSIWDIAFQDPLGVKAYKNESLDFCHSRLYKQPSQPSLVRLTEIYINRKLRKLASLVSSFVAFICSLNMLQNIQLVFFLFYQCTYITVYNTHFKVWRSTHSVVLLNMDFPFNTLPFSLLTPLLSGSSTK